MLVYLFYSIYFTKLNSNPLARVIVIFLNILLHWQVLFIKF